MCVRHSVVSNSLQSQALYVAHQAPLSMVFSRQEYWSGLPLPWDIPSPGIETLFLMFNLRHEFDMRFLSNLKVGGFFTTSATWEAPSHDY